MNHHCCDIWYWRASDQEAVARHLSDRGRTNAEPGPPRRTGLLRSAITSVLHVAGLAERPFEAGMAEREEVPARKGCGCGGGEFEHREAVLLEGEWALRCPGCGHVDRLQWLSEESRHLLVGLARRRRWVRVRRT